MDKRHLSPPAVGGSSLLVIFAVLCLTVFALLTLSTVQADRRLADAAAQAVTDYYAADVRAEEILARLRAGETPEGVEQAADGTYCYTCPISDTQALSVQVRLEDGTWQVLRWQTVSTAEWQPDASLDVWDGGEPE